MLKGRVSVLQLHESKNEYRAYQNEQRYQFHQQMREELSKERQQKEQHMRQVLRKMQEAQEQARKDRRDHELNLKRAQDELNRSRADDYRYTKEQQDEIERSLGKFHEEDSSLKQQRKLSIREFEKNQRRNVQEYMQNRKRELLMNETAESSKISRIKEERGREIEELGKLESLMLERQARSRMSSEESEMKLKKLLNGGKPLSTSHTTKLPSIANEKRQNSELDVLLF